MNPAGADKAMTDLTLDVLVEKLASRIVAKLVSAQRGVATEGVTYTSKAPPPGMSRKRFNEVCRERVGQGDKSIRKVGRVWVAPAAAFEKRPRLALPKERLGAAWTPEDVLASVGVRPTR